jgi:hypothetical protein
MMNARFEKVGNEFKSLFAVCFGEEKANRVSRNRRETLFAFS